MNDRFHYDALVDDALRSVVRRVLRQVADKGLPGSHHFYISFRSTDPGVQLPDTPRRAQDTLLSLWANSVSNAASFPGPSDTRSPRSVGRHRESRDLAETASQRSGS